MLKHPGPYLILPNHPAYADPPNLLARLLPYFQMRPVFLETNFQNPVMAPFAWISARHPRAGYGQGEPKRGNGPRRRRKR